MTDHYCTCGSPMTETPPEHTAPLVSTRYTCDRCGSVAVVIPAESATRRDVVVVFPATEKMGGSDA